MRLLRTGKGKDHEKMKKVILASGSPRRKELLEQIGAVFEVRKTDGEEVLLSRIPEEAAEELALQKAR